MKCTTTIFIFILSISFVFADCLGDFQGSWAAEDEAYLAAYGDCEDTYSNSMSQMLCKSEEYVQHLQAQDGILTTYSGCCCINGLVCC